jgi:nicotinamide-nucleotide amidase
MKRYRIHEDIPLKRRARSREARGLQSGARWGRRFVGLWVWLMACVGPCLTQPATPDRPALDYVIVVTGGEVLEGLFPDSHTHFLTRTLRSLGGRCVGSVTVDDREQDLSGALCFGLGKAPLVIVTGGLGPTPNDITREAISRFTGLPLREHEEVVAGMERRFGQSREQLRANLRRQALVPSSGDYLTNSVGTAVGLVFETTNATIVALPGPPRELQPMVEQQLLPFLQRHFGLRRPGASLTLRFVGLGQSQISQTLQDQVKLPPELVITSQFEAGRVDFTFALPGDTEAERAWLGALAGTMRGQLGAHLYAEDDSTLEAKVMGAFARRGLTLALVEIGTGGHVTDSLTQVAEVERVLVGSYVAPTEGRVTQLLQLPVVAGSDDERLLGIVREARIRSRCDVAVLVCTPDPAQAPSRGVRVVWVDAGHRQTEIPWTDSTVASQALLTTRVLDWLRLQIAREEQGK